jgi:ArsR family transcriptional regulator
MNISLNITILEYYNIAILSICYISVNIRAMNTLNIEEYTKIFAALGHPIRLNIACGLFRNGKCNVNTMSERLNISQALVSQHVKILREAKIIEGKREGNIIWYSICSENTKKLLECVDLNLCSCQNK